MTAMRNGVRWGTLALLVVLWLVAMPAEAGEGAIGKWKVDLEGPQGAVEVVIEITQGEGGLEGTWTGPRGTSDLQDVTFQDGQLQFKRSVDSPQGQFELRFEGAVDGDQLDGKLISPRGERPVKGTRVE